MNETGKFYGRYRGVVVSNIDTEKTGRLLVRVQDVLGDDPCIWAESASPVAGMQMGMYAVPPPNSGVWVEFEKGDPDYAVWTGSWRGSSIEVPNEVLTASPATPPIVIQSLTQNRIIISSTPGEGITLETAAGPVGPRIEISATKIKMSVGPLVSIELGPDGVKINGEALVIR
jgi:hypothetical protein